MQTLFEAFQSAAQQSADRIAIIDYHSGSQHTYESLLILTHQFILRLQKDCPFKPTDRICILMSNEVEFVAAFFALQALGCVVIPLSTKLSQQETLHIIEDAGVTGLVTSSEYLETTYPVLSHLSFVLHTDGKEVQWHHECLYVSMHDAPLEKAYTPLPADLPMLASGDLAVLIYTSGTTGKPKGVMLSHRNLLADAEANTIAIECSSADVFITASPLFHVFGLTNVMLTSLINGATLVLVRRFNPKSILEAITRHRVSFLAAVPTMYQMMLTLLPDKNSDLSSLRVCHSGAAPMPQAVFHQVEALFGAPVQEGYGQSEASSIMTSNPLRGERKPGSIGKALHCLTIELVDENKCPVPLGQIGELRAKGDTVMLGYWNNPHATARTLQNGWLYTSDMGYADDDGYIFLSGRRDDMINVGGAKVYPQEVEDVLYQHPDIQSCAVTGEGSSLYYQVVVAYIVLKPRASATAVDLQKFCKSNLAAYKVPTSIYFVAEIPKGATGKILRHRLRPSANLENPV